MMMTSPPIHEVLSVPKDAPVLLTTTASGDCMLLLDRLINVFTYLLTYLLT